jgi:hypothetical protein
LLELEIIDRMQKDYDKDALFDWEVSVVSIKPSTLSLDTYSDRLSLVDLDKRNFISALYYALKEDASKALEYLKNSDPDIEERKLLLDHIKRDKMDLFNFERQNRT